MKNSIIYCTSCVNPISTVGSSFNKENVCSACEYHKGYQSVSDKEWEVRRNEFKKILDENKSDSNYDCIVPVSIFDSFRQIVVAIICNKQRF